MPNSTCAEPECARPIEARGWCHTHYARARKGGLPNLPRLNHAEPKACRACGITKQPSEFPLVRSGSTARRGNCKACAKAMTNKESQRAASKRWQLANPDRYEAQQRSSWLRLKYGIAASDYDRMVVEQGDKCAICNVTKPGGNLRYWCVDHNHETGKVRALLCATCNTGLGLFRDSVDVLAGAIAYLVRHDGDD